MKIVLVHGQNHKGSTYHISRELVDSISCDKEIKEFFLPRDLNHFCLGCYNCVEDEKKCPYYDEKSKIMNEIEAADLIIMTSPNYCMAPSAPLKSFIDLTFTYWMAHKPRTCMFRKKAVIISTAAGAGTRSVIKPVKRTLFYWGISYIKKYGISVQAKGWDEVKEKKKNKIKKDVKKLAKKLSVEKEPRVKLKNKLMFNMMRFMQKCHVGSGETERKYWEDRGWLDKERPWR